MPEVLAYPEERVSAVVSRLAEGFGDNKDIRSVGHWVNAHPSLLLKVLQSDASFYYVLDMPAEVMRQSSSSSSSSDDDDDEQLDPPVWTKVGVFPAQRRKK